MNERGQVVIEANLTGTSNSGIFVADRSITSAVALAGNAGPHASISGSSARHRLQQVVKFSSVPIRVFPEQA
jgi:hypothetical protein